MPYVEQEPNFIAGQQITVTDLNRLLENIQSMASTLGLVSGQVSPYGSERLIVTDGSGNLTGLNLANGAMITGRTDNSNRYRVLAPGDDGDLLTGNEVSGRVRPEWRAPSTISFGEQMVNIVVLGN